MHYESAARGSNERESLSLEGRSMSQPPLRRKHAAREVKPSKSSQVKLVTEVSNLPDPCGIHVLKWLGRWAARFVPPLCLVATGRTHLCSTPWLPQRGDRQLCLHWGSIGVGIFEKRLLQARQRNSSWCSNLALPHHNTILGSASLGFNRERRYAMPSDKSRTWRVCVILRTAQRVG